MITNNPVTDFLRAHRFSVTFDGGLPMGFSRVEIAPREAHTGPGMACFEAAMTPLLADMLNQRKTSQMVVGSYGISEEILTDEPVLSFVLRGVRPASARMGCHIIWEAASNEILKVNFTLDYQQLEMRPGGQAVIRPLPARPRASADPIVIC